MGTMTTSAKIAAAAGRLLDKQGADAVTMRRVAKLVGITPMALYRHFADRDGLLNALADRGFEELAAQLPGAQRSDNPEKQLMVILDLFLDFGLAKPRLFELMFLRPRAGARQFPGDFRAGRSPTAKFSAASLEAGMEQGIFRKDDAWEISFETGALLQGLLMLYIGGRIATSEDEFRALCHRAFGRYIRGIRK